MTNETLKRKIVDMVTADMIRISEEVGEAEKALNDVLSKLSKEQAAYAKLCELAANLHASMLAEQAALNKEKKQAQEMSDSAKKESEAAKNLSQVVADEVLAAERKIKELQRDIAGLKEEYKVRQEEELRIGNDRINELRAELERRIPVINKKEAELKVKEADLVVIESRWKKMFGDKGMGFKI